MYVENTGQQIKMAFAMNVICNKEIKENVMKKSIIDRVEENGYRVEYQNGNYKVYKYSEEHKAYLFYGYYADKKELKELL